MRRYVKNVRIGDQPHDRLSHMARAVGAAFEGHVDRRENDRIIIIIEDDHDVGTMVYGHEDTADVGVTLIMLLQAMFPDMEIVLEGENAP